MKKQIEEKQQEQDRAMMDKTIATFERQIAHKNDQGNFLIRDGEVTLGRLVLAAGDAMLKVQQELIRMWQTQTRAQEDTLHKFFAPQASSPIRQSTRLADFIDEDAARFRVTAKNYRAAGQTDLAKKVTNMCIAFDAMAAGLRKNFDESGSLFAKYNFAVPATKENLQNDHNLSPISNVDDDKGEPDQDSLDAWKASLHQDDVVHSIRGRFAEHVASQGI